MIRQTSINCYNQIKSNGLLSKRRMEVYEILVNHGPMTANEIVRKSKIDYPDTNPSSFHARLSELKRYGVIKEIGEKQDSISGNNCYIWDVTNNLPVKPKKSKKPSNLNKCIDYILKGMDIRGWDSISKDVLIKLKTNGAKTKEAT